MKQKTINLLHSLHNFCHLSLLQPELRAYHVLFNINIDKKTINMIIFLGLWRGRVYLKSYENNENYF